MILFLLPPMAFGTVHAIGATCALDTLDILVLLPEGAFDGFVIIFFGVPPVILDIVGVDAVRSIVLARYGAPYSFICVQVELQIFLHFVDQLERDFGIVVSKRAEFAIRAS